MKIIIVFKVTKTLVNGLEIFVRWLKTYRLSLY
jgi:hypothetical protein